MSWRNESNWKVLHNFMECLIQNPENYIKHESKQASQILNRAMNNEEPILFYIAKNSFSDSVIKYILFNGKTDLFEETCWGLTPIHAASKYNNKNFLQILLDEEVDINFKNKKNQTPLMIACFHGHVELVEFLLQKGADPTILDYKNRKAIDYSTEGKKNEISYFLSQYK